jgi:hypothetical protein
MTCGTPGASWLRQNDVPTWVLQELGGWKSESMVRRYAHMSVKHLQPYADQLIFRGDAGHLAEPQKTAEAHDTKSRHRRGNPDYMWCGRARNLLI